MSDDQISPILRLSLLGPPQVIRNGEEITAFRTAKAQALLFYLALSDGEQPRTSLAALFWPNSSQKAASASLRNTLSILRRLLAEHLVVARQTIALKRDTIWLDVDQFVALLRRTGAGAADALQFQTAISMYRGDFLEGFHVAGAPGFEQWMAIKRESLRDAMLQALLELARWHADQRDYAASLDHLTHLLSLEPASEVAHRQKMAVLALMGQRTAALVQYNTCRTILVEELGVEPSPDTTALRELILTGALGQAGSRPAGSLESFPPVKAAVPEEPPLLGVSVPAAALERPIFDWGDMPARSAFYGRQEDLSQLNRWLTRDHAGLVAIIGLGGVGKTTLAVELMERLIAGTFHTIAWRSLINAPSLTTLLDTWLQVLAGQGQDRLPENLDDKLALLFGELSRRRCLLVLDNLESILHMGHRSGLFRPGYEDYGQLIDRLARVRHQSCLLFTARELPRGLRRLEEDYPKVRILTLEGLPSASGIELLRARGVAAPDASLAMLAERYSGNPLALKLVADSVRDLFGSDVEAFFKDELPVFGEIREVLDQQFDRLSNLERDILIWLATEREPVSPQVLWNSLLQPPRRGEFLDAMRSLQRNSLVQEVTGTTSRQAVRLALQNVVMEYATDLLVKTLCMELAGGPLDWLHRHALVKANSRDFVQETQRGLLLQPTARCLVHRLGRTGAIQQLRNLLACLREEAGQAPGFAAANILHLLLFLEVDLRGWDFSQLAVWQADLRKASLVDVNFRQADLTGSTFANTFGSIMAFAVSPDGRYLAAGGTDGTVHIWSMADHQPAHMLRGHRHFVTALAFSDDGRFLASGGHEAEIRLWDMQAGEIASSLRREEGPVQAWSISIRGNLLAVAGRDRTIDVWHWPRGELLRRVSAAGIIDAVAISPDGRFLAGVGEGGALTMWDVSSGEVVHTGSAAPGRGLTVAFSPDGKLLATAGEDSHIHLWNSADMSLHQMLAGHDGWILSLSFSPDGKYLASASADHTARIWHIERGSPARVLTGHEGWVRSITYTPDGQSLVTGGDDRTLRLWDARTGELRHFLQGHLRWTDLVAFSPNGEVLASGGYGGTVRLWDVATGRLRHQLRDHRGATRALAFSHDSTLLACGSDDHTASLWNVQTGALTRVLHGHQGLVRYVAFSSDDRFLLTGSHDETVRVWEVATGRQRQVIPNASARIQCAMAFDPSGQFLAFGALDHAVKLLHLASGEIVANLPMADKQPSVVAFSPQGNSLACGTHDGTVWMWDVDATDAKDIVIRGPTHRIQLERDTVWRLLFSPDGQLLVQSSESHHAPVLDVGSGQKRYAVRSHYGAFCLDFSPDGETLITAGDNYAILLRDARTGEIRQSLSGHEAGLTSLAVSPDGEKIASSSADGTVRLWDMASGACLAVLEPAGPYEGMNITGVRGVTAAERAALIALGAWEDS